MEIDMKVLENGFFGRYKILNPFDEINMPWWGEPYESTWVTESDISQWKSDLFICLFNTFE